jgi:DNA-directed RNA polymerase specialized sigma24 family protein
LQEVFVRIWKDIDCYDPSKERLFTWIFRITLNVCGQNKETLKTINR